MEKINIKGRELSYSPEHLSYETSVPLNIKEAKENLLDFKKTADENNLVFILAYGTLLGAIREHNFIKHDIDIDLISYDEIKLIDMIQKLQNEGFNFVRYEINPLYYSFKRNSVYIDVYIASKVKNSYYLLNKKIKSSYITKTVQYSFLGALFLIPKEYEKILVELYGKDWLIPQKDKYGNFQDHDIRKKIFIYIKNLIPKKIKVMIKELLGYKIQNL
jgi:lipopolysaccharide cholinephosphotransferase